MFFISAFIFFFNNGETFLDPENGCFLQLVVSNGQLPLSIRQEVVQSYYQSVALAVREDQQLIVNSMLVTTLPSSNGLQQ